MVGQICPGVTVWMSRLAGDWPALCQAKMAPGGTRTKLPAGMAVAPGDVVLVKASRAARLDQMVEGLLKSRMS